MGRFEYLVEKQRFERRRRRAALLAKPISREVLESEWHAAPLGRLGRSLWDDIDRYLEFFAIAGEPHAGPTVTAISGAKRRASGISARPETSR